ncbi:uncharacterized protein LOC107866142 [Capsicum annuum]|uniref:uncharacterized protein LOC107866142 n=1 Tax=Capsicum annuum TaxID=4072 RepID=UPI001FB056AF|nr:uncharacterized protein LOC107866142 [Capsicum annuum]
MSQQQQPVEGFPNDMPVQPKNSPISQPSSHSNGSFGTVFIILAVVLVISVLSCLIGRICNKRSHGLGHHYPSKQIEAKQGHDIHPNQGHDIEFGIDKRIPTSKVATSNGDTNTPTYSMPSDNGHQGNRGVRFAEDH